MDLLLINEDSFAWSGTLDTATRMVAKRKQWPQETQTQNKVRKLNGTLDLKSVHKESWRRLVHTIF